jgi:hypothetical protein
MEAYSGRLSSKMRYNSAMSTPEYQAWRGMINRCYRAKTSQYPNYGGRGIMVCDRWRHSFSNFLMDMGMRPSSNHSLDRKNVNGHYAPENCIWSLPQEQARNRRNSILLTFRGETLTAAEWADKLSLSRPMVFWRIHQGWPVEKILTAPAGTVPKKSSILLTHQGETLCIAEWARRIGLSESALTKRLRRGLSVEQALTMPRNDTKATAKPRS